MIGRFRRRPRGRRHICLLYVCIIISLLIIFCFNYLSAVEEYDPIQPGNVNHYNKLLRKKKP